MFMRHLIYFIFFAGFFFTLASCSNKQYQALFEEKARVSDTSAQKYGTLATDYQIHPHDLLQIRNQQNIGFIVNDAVDNSLGSNNATGETFEVNDDGILLLPEIGKVPVAGLTRVKANQLIQDLYHKALLKDPIIELKIINLKVILYGEVKTVGSIPLTKDRTTLVEMLAIAGGLTPKADETHVEIIRGNQKSPAVTVIDLSNIQSINDPAAILKNGDIIYVPENKRGIRNDKLQNFSSIFQPAILIFNTALIIISLIRR
jgi:polysaccharide export outer membrane protein